MPYRSRFRTRGSRAAYLGMVRKTRVTGRRRRIFRGKFSRKNASMSVADPRHGALLQADRRFMKMKFSERVQVAPGSPNYQLAFNGNSLSTTAALPGGTGLSYLYQYYRVWGSSIKIRWVNDTATGARVVVFPKGEVAAFSGTADQAAMEAYARETFTGGPSGMDRCVVKQFMKTAKILGLQKRAIGTNNDYAGTIANPPAATTSWTAPTVGLWQWIISASSMDATTALTGAYILDVTYYVELFNRRDPIV